MLDQVIRQAAEQWGDRTVLVAASGWSLSYAELDRISDEVARGLALAGIGEGDVVALVLPPIPEHVLAYAALAKLGAICAGVNDRLTAGERQVVVERATPTLVITTETLAPTGHHTIEIVPATSANGALDELRRFGPSDVLDPDPDRAIAIVFTSGTTGIPKGAVFCGRQFAFITEVDTGHRWGPGGTGLSATALAHLGPTTKLAGNLHRGGTTYLVDRWRAGDALALTARHRMTAVAGIPTQIALMLRHPDFEATDLSSVQAVILGGGPASPSLVRESRERFAAPVATRYACTEAGIGLGTLFTDDPVDAEVSVGRPHHWVDLSLRDPTSGREVAPGDVGEVCLRSPAQMDGYWRDPVATAAAVTPDGFVRTGDLGRLDEEGRLRLVGRAREMYVRGGYNVYPMEVEGVLADDPAVAQVAVVARPDDVMGEVGVAFVVPSDPDRPPDVAALRARAEEQLAAHKLPEEVRLVGSLPLTPMEKVDRAELRRRL